MPLEPDHCQSIRYLAPGMVLLANYGYRPKHAPCVNRGCAVAHSQPGHEKKHLTSSWVCPKSGELRGVRGPCFRTTCSDNVGEGWEWRGRKKDSIFSLQKGCWEGKALTFVKGVREITTCLLIVQTKTKLPQNVKIIILFVGK